MEILISYPAQIVFTEADRGGVWHGRLLNARGSVDTQGSRPGPPYGLEYRPIVGRPFYKIESRDGRFYATFQGGNKNSRRYRTFQTLNEAQKHAIRWAGQRFRVIVPQRAD